MAAILYKTIWKPNQMAAILSEFLVFKFHPFCFIWSFKGPDFKCFRILNGLIWDSHSILKKYISSGIAIDMI